jgi:hypothetical protein
MKGSVVPSRIAIKSNPLRQAGSLPEKAAGFGMISGPTFPLIPA